MVREGFLAIKFTGVSLLGLATDAVVLHFGIAAGLQPAWARVVSLFCAMQVTFVINSRHVFRSADRSRPWSRWTSYMLANSIGNACNYWVFVALVSTHWRVVSDPMPALAVGSFAAWVINYAGARLVVFRKPKAPALVSSPRIRAG